LKPSPYLGVAYPLQVIGNRPLPRLSLPVQFVEEHFPRVPAVFARTVNTVRHTSPPEPDRRIHRKKYMLASPVPMQLVLIQ
jgi:hypothetical protein